MKLRFFLILVAAYACLAADGDIAIQTANGHKVIPAAEAKVLQAHNEWLVERMTEANAIKEGGTYAELVKHFHLDGGLHGGNTRRFVHNLAWNLKIDVTFEGKVHFEGPDPGQKIKSVSRPYLDGVRID